MAMPMGPLPPQIPNHIPGSGYNNNTQANWGYPSPRSFPEVPPRREFRPASRFQQAAPAMFDKPAPMLVGQPPDIWAPRQASDMNILSSTGRVETILPNGMKMVTTLEANTSRQGNFSTMA